MESLVPLFNEWEIQILVLFSFTIQFFLFFAGGIRLRITSGALKLLIWLAYLGADFVAAYVLGLISRLGDATAGTHQLALLWAPFLLIHLGGQDTITAFSIEDNNLWTRHLLNLVVQVSLTLYILGKSTNDPTMQLRAPSILLFVTGTIKYGERTWALWSSSLENLGKAHVSNYMESPPIEESMGYPGELQLAEPIDSESSYSDLVCIALRSMFFVRLIFLGNVNDVTCTWHGLFRPEISTKLLEIMTIEVSLMFDDIYTKALVLRTRSGIILRCLSDISFLAAFVLFYVRNKERYSPVDTAVTYGLFIGGLFLEVSSLFITIMSTRFWAWLKIRHWSFIASISIRWQRKRVLWSYSMGQYCLLNYLGQYDQPSSKVMPVVRKMVSAVCGVKQKLWVSKLLDTKFVNVDEKIMKCVVQKIAHYPYHSAHESNMLRPILGPLLRHLFRDNGYSTLHNIFYLHVYTEVQLSRYATTSADSESNVHLCQTISNYIVYLLAMHPRMMQLVIVPNGPHDSLEEHLATVLKDLAIHPEYDCKPSLRRSKIVELAANWLNPQYYPERPEVCTEAELSEIQEIWVGLLIYIASKSPPEMHAAQLGRGGELLTFIWLLMAHRNLGGPMGFKFGIIHRPRDSVPRPEYIFYLPEDQS